MLAVLANACAVLVSAAQVTTVSLVRAHGERSTHRPHGIGIMATRIAPSTLHAGPTPRFVKNAARAVSARGGAGRGERRTVREEREARAEARAEEVVPGEHARDVARVAVAKVAVRGGVSILSGGALAAATHLRPAWKSMKTPIE
jgi:hypothetical protein